MDKQKHPNNESLGTQPDGRACCPCSFSKCTLLAPPCALPVTATPTEEGDNAGAVRDASNSSQYTAAPDDPSAEGVGVACACISSVVVVVVVAHVSKIHGSWLPVLGAWRWLPDSVSTDLSTTGSHRRFFGRE